MNLESYEKMVSSSVNKAFIDACLKGDLVTVKDLLTSNEMEFSLEENPYLLDEGMLEASHAHKNNVVKYLLASPELKKHANVNTMKDMLFRTTSVNGNIEILNFIIFDLNLKKSDDIVGYMNSEHYSLSRELFRQRDILNLNNEINSELPVNSKPKQKKLKA